MLIFLIASVLTYHDPFLFLCVILFLIVFCQFDYCKNFSKLSASLDTYDQMLCVVFVNKSKRGRKVLSGDWSNVTGVSSQRECLSKDRISKADFQDRSSCLNVWSKKVTPSIDFFFNLKFMSSKNVRRKQTLVKVLVFY